MLKRLEAEAEAEFENRVAVEFGKRAMYFAMEVLGEGSKVTPARLLEHWAEVSPESRAICSPDGTYTWKKFDARANQVACVLLSSGAKLGDSVAIMLDSRQEFLFALFGAAKVGIAAGLINTNLSGDALKHAVTICKSDWVIVGEEHVARFVELGESLPVSKDRVLVWSDPTASESPCEEHPFVDFDDKLKGAHGSRGESSDWDAGGDPALPFVYICTSGTTGLPKAALVSARRYLQGVYYYSQAILSANTDDVSYTSGLPLYHNVALSQGFGIALSGGGAVAIRRKFSASEFWDDCKRWGCTTFAYVGEVCRYLHQAPTHPSERDHSLRCMIGAGLRPEIWDAFVNRFSIPAVYEYYGATEGNVGLVNLTGKPGMVGKISPERGHVLVRIDPDTEEFLREDSKLVAATEGESGMLIAKIGPMAGFAGYADKSKNSAKVLENPFGRGELYFNTGDLLTLHERNWVSFADRLGDTFRWRGENVSTAEVQDSLSQCKGVRDAVVYGVVVPGEEGRAGMAAITVDSSFDITHFATFAKEHLPPYARPVFVRIDESLPMTGSYKFVKTALKREGYDPALVTGKLYVGLSIGGNGSYTPLDKNMHARIVQHGMSAARSADAPAPTSTTTRTA